MVSCNRCDHFMVCQYTGNNVDECSYFKSHANTVEVLRCKDCKHWKHFEHIGCTDFVKVCGLANYMIGANGYCLYGERKDNENSRNPSV